VSASDVGTHRKFIFGLGKDAVQLGDRIQVCDRHLDEFERRCV
jgi:hypothetical protein